jgi:hypothetical protein
MGADMTAALACLAFWLALTTLVFIAVHSWSAVYTAALAVALWAEVQHRVGGL